MKQIFFYTFLLVFAATAAVTLLGIIGSVQIKEEYLTKLFYALIVESIAPVIALFQKTDFFGNEKTHSKTEMNRLSVVLLPQESFGRAGDPHSCKITVYNPESDEEHELSVNLKRSNGYLSAFLDNVSEDVLIKVSVQNSQREAWESQYFSPTIAKAEMEQI